MSARSKGVAYINPSPDQTGHVCVRDERGQRLDSASGPRDEMIVRYHNSGYDVRDEQGRTVDLHDVIKSEAQGSALGMEYDWCGQRWMRKVSW